MVLKGTFHWVVSKAKKQNWTWNPLLHVEGVLSDLPEIVYLALVVEYAPWAVRCESCLVDNVLWEVGYSTCVRTAIAGLEQASIYFLFRL